ncbi:class II poly(R)-hydroxyalkanoic acid synthase [Pseudomaricurvus alkylphenolicus]|uniref:PHA/PHB synthase family protein n=1 Tax=Pseudomaricurvus alkylphenolicus TaxID=1306991 RepID=UPI0014216FBD|nr:class II poly(R)-hydroxyalkanoic acid synthase [Pseudomaricurvus alkylphenolicus]NIB39648.1 class II poly(R)-hydroxyalkanoic acid synthase [Pseudomaricurvus alkylphenolicus]
MNSGSPIPELAALAPEASVDIKLADLPTEIAAGNGTVFRREPLSVINEISLDCPDDELLSSLERVQSSAQKLNRFVNAFRKSRYETAKASSGDATKTTTRTTSTASLKTQASSDVQVAKAEASAGSNVSKSDKKLPGKGVLESFGLFFRQTSRQPEVFVDHCSSFVKEVARIATNKSDIEPERGDKRFRDAVWRENFLYRKTLQTYLAWDREVSGWVDDLDLDDADHRRTHFLYQQVSALISPTNSPMNPVAVKRAFQTGGKSYVDGVSNLLQDWRTNHGMPTQIKSDAFEVGRNLANSAGAVVHRSDVLELIQYRMEEGQTVQKRPVLIVPPQVNKFYVFDLTPKNSLVHYLKTQGIQPFVISWRNPNAHCADWGLDRYVTELEKAIEVMCEITGNDSINLASACAGGITSMALLGYLAAVDKPLVHSHSMFVTALQTDDTSALGLFATREAVELSRKRSQAQGFMNGKELSHIFAWLRPTDLVWNYWVNNYLLGKEPPSMDILYWDNDSTRLPAGLHSDFLDILIDDAFAEPGRLVVKGQPVDIRRISMDFYCVGGDEDYLMPWKKCYEVPDLLNTDCTFVLSTSGHIQSILRPPGIANTFYYTNDSRPANADQWRADAQRHSGSWWEHWQQWLVEHSDEEQVAPERLGSYRYPPLCQAPGLYVNERVT